MLAALLISALLGPTVTISGATSIDDNPLRSSDEFNFGTDPLIIAGVGGGVTYHQMIRFDKTLIPAGAITGFRVNIWRTTNASSINTGNLDAYFVADANTWVEGTVDGALQVGSSSQTFAKRSTQAWAGSILCGTSGTDYDANATPPTLAYSACTACSSTKLTITLPTAWAVAWRDGTRANNGIMLRSRSEAANDLFVGLSSDSGTTPLTFEIDTAPSGIFWSQP